MGQFVYVVRKRIKLSAEKAIFVFVTNMLPPTGESDFYVEFCPINILNSLIMCFIFDTASLMSAIYDEYKDEDGFLYMTYSGENTFGVRGDTVSVNSILNVNISSMH